MSSIHTMCLEIFNMTFKVPMIQPGSLLDWELYGDNRKHAQYVNSCYHVNTKHVLSRSAYSCLGDQLVFSIENISKLFVFFQQNSSDDCKNNARLQFTVINHSCRNITSVIQITNNFIFINFVNVDLESRMTGFVVTCI